MRMLIYVTLVFSVVFYNAHAEICNEHIWNAYPPVDKTHYNYEKHPVDDNYISFVRKDLIPDAIKLLEDQSLVEVSTKKANMLAGYKVWLKEKTKLYLVRALKDKSNAVIRVYHYKNEIRVVSFAVGAPGKVSETPIIVSLSSKPERVYIYCEGV